MGIKIMDDKKVKEYLIHNYMPLIHSAANKIVSNKEIPPHMEAGDLFEHGVHGLMDGISKLNPEKTKNPTPYLKHRIIGAMRDHIRDQSPVLGSSDIRSALKEAKENKVNSFNQKTPISHIEHISRNLSESTREKLKNKIKEYEGNESPSVEAPAPASTEVPTAPKPIIRRKRDPNA